MRLLQYDAPAGVIERWQPELDRIAPRSDNGYAWLQLVWEPGDPWAPIERWVVYEVMPAHRAMLDIFEQLRGPNPRDFLRRDPVTGKLHRERNFNINQAQWLFYQRTGYFGRPFWVVQGDRGGHLRHWSDVMRNLSLMHEGPPHPPAPGDLPYAEPDARTIARISAMDLVARFGGILDTLANDEARRSSLDLREASIAREMARQMWTWLSDQADDALDLMSNAAASRFWDERAVDDPDYVMPDFDADEEEAIQDLASRVAF